MFFCIGYLIVDMLTSAVVDFTCRGGTYMAGYTTTCDWLYTTLTMLRKGVEATLGMTLLVHLTILQLTQLSVVGLGLL
jgi:hypothetical protein